MNRVTGGYEKRAAVGRRCGVAVVWVLAVCLGMEWARAVGGGGYALAADPVVTVRTMTWQELVPKDWDPMKNFRNRKLDTLREGSEGEMDMMREMREVWDNAPTRLELDGLKVKLPGYVVPLDATQGGKLSQFLLVPYLGACVHSPPPPANQIVHVTLKTPAVWRTMDTVWVSGSMVVKRQKSDMGMSGYAISADVVEPYKAPGK